MSEERRKMNKQYTGTVPKTKCRNNASYSNERDSPHSWTNNLASDFQRLNVSEFVRNSQRNAPTSHPNYCTMNTAIDEQRPQNLAMNGSVTTNTSSSTSRRNSSGTVPKCDNVSKYPDKKQIEDKLHQIREYLQVTTSLMTTMKNSQEPSYADTEVESVAKMISNLRDSEAKLVNLLESYDADFEPVDSSESENETDQEQQLVNGNGFMDDKVEHTNREMEMLRDQQMTLMSLQQKAENKMKEARQIQDKLLMASTCNYGNEVNSSLNFRDKNFGSVQDFDVAIKELEERTKRLNEPRSNSNTQLQDKLLADVDSLQSQLLTLHNANDERVQLIQVLDNRDAELRSQHRELQSKLSELQNKKHKVDQLVEQLQVMDDVEAEDEDVGAQVRRIMLMKDQLGKLKDMLEIVKTTEDSMESATPEEQDLACEVCTKAENFLKNDEEKRASRPNNETRRKQVNKNGDRHGQGTFGGAKPKSSLNSNQITLQAELEAKKRELEEIMGKHKAATSNLNHDVIGQDNKSEFSCSSNAFYEAGVSGWPPVMSEHNRFDSSERYSSDDGPDEANEYLIQPQFSLPIINIPRVKPEQGSAEYSQIRPESSDRFSLPSRTPERNMRGRSRSNSNAQQNITKGQVQKQLELIRSVCDSMLEQNQPSNVQLRNNLTPSPIYSEARRIGSPNPNAMNQICEPANDANFQGLLTTNNLQTQAFMLNTLNQCCQMLWLQQRELITLRQTVGQLQEKIEGNNVQFESHLGSPMNPPPPQGGSNRNLKVNQVAAACSMPNLNQYNMPVNMGPNNIPNTRLIDPCLNNANMSSGDHINNSILHGVNANINQMQGQIWNGQALNNQVAPGNRANNYWDNFRSYSRQNLLSNKNEGIPQNGAGMDSRTNITNNITNPFALIQIAKSNSHQTSTNASQENTPQRRARFSVRNSDSRSNNTAVPPDVLNVNHNVNKSHNEAQISENNRNTDEQNLCCHFLNNTSYNETGSNTSNFSEEQIFKECISETARRRNEWHEEQNEESLNTKSKLFEELRENVYKEVVTLISANEARPHFLIQLFRDLQMISSDPLRLKILQSIQTIITHSLVSSNHINRQILDLQANEQLLPDNFSLQSTVWSKPKNPHCRNSLQSDTSHSSVKDIIPFLNDHEEEIINPQFLINLKQTLLESESFQESVRDSVFKKHFANVLDEVLTQFLGKKVQDVKMHVIQTVNDLLRGELSFIQLIQDTCPENSEINEILPGHHISHTVENNQPENSGIQNGDLAEADQGRVVEDDDIEEEGAVGGLWDFQIETPLVAEEVEISDFQNSVESQTQFIKQGLDQVPTRLPTKSRSNTPSKDRPTSSRSEHHDQF